MSATDRSKNEAQKVAAEVKEKAGEITDDHDLQACGKADQTEGDLKQAGEKVKDAFEH
jgi:uncharacterized protein YjbJ (UPF0337 family)